MCWLSFPANIPEEAMIISLHLRLVHQGGACICTRCHLSSVTTQVLHSLAFLHGLGLIHCDIKPENIMIADFKQPLVKIIDLGSSCFQYDALATYVQSRSYRAPEVILKARYNSKIDIWSLGCILAELLLGSVLFQVRPCATRGGATERAPILRTIDACAWKSTSLHSSAAHAPSICERLRTC
jgi:serine/threonine protein kinase